MVAEGSYSITRSFPPSGYGGVEVLPTGPQGALGCFQKGRSRKGVEIRTLESSPVWPSENRIARADAPESPIISWQEPHVAPRLRGNAKRPLSKCALRCCEYFRQFRLPVWRSAALTAPAARNGTSDSWGCGHRGRSGDRRRNWRAIEKGTIERGIGISSADHRCLFRAYRLCAIRIPGSARGTFRVRKHPALGSDFR